MKDIVTKIYESDEWNPSLNSHKQAYNSFIKWYDRQLNHMNKEELTDMLKSIIKEIEDDSLDVIKQYKCYWKSVTSKEKAQDYIKINRII